MTIAQGSSHELRIVVAYHSGGRERAGHQADAAALVAGAIERLGHHVDTLDVSDELGRAVQTLENQDPDLVLDLSRGRGRHGELLLPAVLEQLDLEFVGADAQTRAIVRDTRLSRVVASMAGVPAPRSVFVRTPHDVPIHRIPFPATVRPNFDEDDGDHRVVRSPADLRATLGDMLAAYPAGVIVEEMVAGQDVTMMVLEDRLPHLPVPITYRLVHGTGAPNESLRDLREEEPNLVRLVTDPMAVRGVRRDDLGRATMEAYKALGLRDAAEVHLRVTVSGEILFIKARAMPRLDAGAAVYRAAASLSCSTDDVVAAIVRSASHRIAEPSHPGVPWPQRPARRPGSGRAHG